MNSLRRDIFIIILCIMVYFGFTVILNYVFIPKSVEIGAQSPMITFSHFYELDDDIDVLFMGTSHAYNGFDPRVLNEKYKIESYNLASSMQSTIMSYYWLKEAIHYNKPKVLVLEVYNMLPYGYWRYEDRYWNTTEGQLRIPINWMRLSENKINCIREISRDDNSITGTSLLFPMIRYHARWDELTAADVVPGYLDYLKGYRGYKYVEGAIGSAGAYAPYKIGGESEPIEKAELITRYTDRIAALCADEDIKLIFVRTPDVDAYAGEYYALQEYAEKLGCRFIDFNEYSVYNGAGYDLAKDNTDSDHANASGARKMTEYIGKIILEEVLDENT